MELLKNEDNDALQILLSQNNTLYIEESSWREDKKINSIYLWQFKLPNVILEDQIVSQQIVEKCA